MDTPGPSTYLFLVILILCSAFFSASETALSSLNRIRVKNRADEGDKRARKVLRLSNDFDATLSAILIGNNVVNNASTALATVLATALLGASGAAVATLVITVLVLIFGEILPKSYAKENAEDIANSFSGILTVLKFVLSPLVWFFVQLKRLFTGRRSAELNVQPSVTEDELKTIIDTVEEEGVLNSQETEIIQSVIDFGNSTVLDILVPRVDMDAVSIDASPEEVVALCIEDGYSRIPVYENDIDHIVGVIHAKDLLTCFANHQPLDLRTLRRDVIFVYRSKHINELLAELRRAKQHLAIVTDEHGGTLGLVTMEDILEELVGEIWDETDSARTMIQQIDESVWHVDGDAHIEDLVETLHLKQSDFEDADFTTVGGWALKNLQHIPAVGEQFTYEQFQITIESMDEKRIAFVNVALLDCVGITE